MILDEPGPSKADDQVSVRPRASSTATRDLPPPYVREAEEVVQIKARLRRRRRRRFLLLIFAVFVVYTIVLVTLIVEVRRSCDLVNISVG
jgi:cell division septal protein FtsQ